MDKQIFQENGNLIIKNDRHRFALIFHNVLWFVGLIFILFSLLILVRGLQGLDKFNYKGVIGIAYLTLWGLIWVRGLVKLCFEYLSSSKAVVEQFTVVKKQAELVLINDPYNTPFFYKSKLRLGFNLSNFYLITNTGVKLSVNPLIFLNTSEDQKIEATYYRSSNFVRQVKVIGVTTINDYNESRERELTDFIVNKTLKGAAIFLLWFLSASLLINICNALP